LADKRAVFLVGFGGPEKPEEVLPFLKDVTAGRNIPEARLALVAKQYEAIGGVSPYTRLTLGQATALQKLLEARGLSLPVRVGYLHSAPRVEETLGVLLREGFTDITVIVMAPHRSPASYDKYVARVEDALIALEAQGLPHPTLRYPPTWHLRLGFIQALADRVLEAAAKLSPDEKRHVELVFTAHSIPESMAAASPYVQQLNDTSRAVMERVHVPYYYLAFQSRSGRPEDPWLGPDIGEFLEDRGHAGLQVAVVAPIGFLVDHVEVLYDLDHLAQKHAEKAEIRMVRAGTVGDHPSFIATLASLVEEAHGKPAEKDDQ
jgi:ferrochelatase